MKKIIKKVCCMLLAICVLISTQSPTYAQNATTNAQVEFTEGQGPTKPVNPDKPDEEIDTEEPVSGSLVIVSVSNFEFGSIPISATHQVYGITIDKPNIQVVDLRGTGDGWKVSAQVSSFKNGAIDTLPGAAILISDGRPNSATVSSLEPVHNINVRLTTDNSPSQIITAEQGAGIGLWVMRWYPPSGTDKYIQLEVPAGSATLGNHTAKINWILENTPST